MCANKPAMCNNKVTTTHQVPVSLTHSERQRHFSFWPEWTDLWFGHRNHSQPEIRKRVEKYYNSNYGHQLQSSKQ